jgi:phosphoglycolate phosphatase
MSMPSRDLVVFDLDGTLIDTAPDLARIMNAILTREGLAALDPDSVRQMVGSGARALMERGLAAAGIAPDDSLLDRLVYEFIEIYQGDIAIDSRPYPGMVDALDRLRARGARLAVCTNKPERLSRLLLAHFDLDDRFAAVVGGDTLARRKPDPDPLIEVIARARGAPGRTVLVGDSITDIKTARAAGVPVIGVSFGYTEIAMKHLGADAVIDHFDELDAALVAVRS